MKRGVVADPGFADWLNDIESGRNSARRDITIEQYDSAGRKVLAFQVVRCAVSQVRPPPRLAAASKPAAIVTLALQIEGWRRAAPD